MSATAENTTRTLRLYSMSRLQQHMLARQLCSDARDVGACDGADGAAELGHGAVVLRPAVQPHVRVGQPRRHRQCPPVGAHKRACVDETQASQQ